MSTPRGPEGDVSSARAGIVTPGRTFEERARHAIADVELQQALENLGQRLFTARDVERDHGALKDRAAAIRREVLADLDGWLGRLSSTLEGLGVTVHRAATAEDARRIIVGIARAEGVQTVVKSKSMATEEIELNEAFEAAGVRSVETDLGEYIVQVAGERPSHMITPAIHKTLRQIRDVLANDSGDDIPEDREAITQWARRRLRDEFLAGDMGVTGANFVAADTGTIVLVTNEGNGRLCTTLPRVHVAVVPVEKVVPRFADVATLLPLLTMSATGQRLTNYLSMITGPRRDGEVDGPERLHVVLLDNNRSALLGTPYEEMLACIRCGACLNVCPVYRRVSGHAYDAVYSGPMGKVLTPLLSVGAQGRDLPGASTLCGACTEACPVEIPLADLLVRLRADLRRNGALVGTRSPAPDSNDDGDGDERECPGDGYPWARSRASVVTPPPRSATLRSLGFGVWARVWAAPAGYRLSTSAARLVSRMLRPGRQWSRTMPGLTGWTASRDLPLPAPRSFRDRWAARERGDERW
jgi:L-lactate dehydrogenase complex protein LldF